MTSKDVLVEGTVNFVVEFWTKYLKPEPEELGGSELNSEPTILELKKIKNYPTKQVLKEFTENLQKLTESKLKRNESFILETQLFPKDELETLIFDLGIDPYLLPESTSTKISLGKIHITDFLGQEDNFKIF